MKSSFMSSVRIKQRILYLVFIFVFLFIYVIKVSNVNRKAATYYHTNSMKSEQECILEQEQKKLTLLSEPKEGEEEKARRSVKYLDLNLNNNNNNKQHLLLLTTINGNDNVDLDTYFDLIDRSSYSNTLITLSFLLTQQDPSLLSQLTRKVKEYQYSRWSNQFFEINILQKDFPSSDTARAKNFLLTSSLREYHDWVVWLDIGLYSFPRTIFHDLISLDEDVIVPNCLLKSDSRDGYDRSNWQESDLSISKQQQLPENQLITRDDNNEIFMGRHSLVDMPTHLGINYRVPLDGVGGSFIMVKSTVHRQGAIFPPFIYQHQTDTEGFAKMVKSMGFAIYGIPGYKVYRALI